MTLHDLGWCLIGWALGMFSTVLLDEWLTRRERREQRRWREKNGL